MGLPPATNCPLCYTCPDCADCTDSTGLVYYNADGAAGIGDSFMPGATLAAAISAARAAEAGPGYEGTSLAWSRDIDGNFNAIAIENGTSYFDFRDLQIGRTYKMCWRVVASISNDGGPATEFVVSSGSFDLTATATEQVVNAVDVGIVTDFDDLLAYLDEGYDAQTCYLLVQLAGMRCDGSACP